MPALLLSWCVGVHRLMASGGVVSFLHDGRAPDVATALTNAHGTGSMHELQLVREAIQGDVVSRFARVILPIGLAQVLLAGLLVVACGLAMGGRRTARSLLLQALAANLAFTAVAYALTLAARGAFVDTLSHAATDLADIPLPGGAKAGEALRAPILWASLRFYFVAFGLAPPALAILAFTRPRARAYFDAAAQVAERAEEEEEP